MTQLFSHYSTPGASVQLPGAPYLVAGALVLCCALIAMRTVPRAQMGAAPIS